jgi:hypothetical protein
MKALPMNIITLMNRTHGFVWSSMVTERSKVGSVPLAWLASAMTGGA